MAAWDKTQKNTREQVVSRAIWSVMRQTEWEAFHLLCQRQIIIKLHWDNFVYVGNQLGPNFESGWLAAFSTCWTRQYDMQVVGLHCRDILVADIIRGFVVNSIE